MAIVQTLTSKEGNGRRLRLSNPATQESIGEIRVGGAPEARQVVERARAAQATWGTTSISTRALYMQRALKLLIERQDLLLDVITRDTGRPRVETLWLEIIPACDALAFYSKHAPQMLAPTTQRPHLFPTKKVVTHYRPRGVVAIISSWQAPFVLSINPAVQALMAGNSVVIKPSEASSFSGRLIADLFRDAGLPEGVLSVLEGDGETGHALIESGVDHVVLIGNAKTGRNVAEACGRSLIPTTLCLAGNDAMIVCDDADLDRAAKAAVFGACANAGQLCFSTERVYVAAAVHDAFVARVGQVMRSLRQSASACDVGPMMRREQLEVVQRHVADAVQRGAAVLIGGARNVEAGELFYQPTLITGVTPEMSIMAEETCGPVLPIMRVRSDDEAIGLANANDCGLSATVWTRDSARAEHIAQQLNVGSVCINDNALTYGITEAAFGGRKHSGSGQLNGEVGLRSFCNTQTVVQQRLGFSDESFAFPYTDEKTRLLQKAIRWIWGTPLGKLLT